MKTVLLVFASLATIHFLQSFSLAFTSASICLHITSRTSPRSQPRFTYRHSRSSSSATRLLRTTRLARTRRLLNTKQLLQILRLLQTSRLHPILRLLKTRRLFHITRLLKSRRLLHTLEASQIYRNGYR